MPYADPVKRMEYQREYQKVWWAKNSERMKVKRRIWVKENREQTREWDRANNKKVREKLIELMKGKCKCCGENDPIYLQFDHVNNDGYLESNGNYNGRNFRLTVNKYKENPKRYQLLCANCNHAKHKNGGKLYKPKKRKPSAKRNKRKT